MVVLGVDTGGTFTDFILFDGNKVKCYKTLSTPKDPSIAVINGLKEITAGSDEKVLIHGSTVATNALLEGKTAKTALVTTQGFEDILEIGRGNRLELYNIFVDSKPVLIPTSLRFSLPERINKDGEIIKPLKDKDIQELINKIKRNKSIESIAVCFLFSYKNPAHEEEIGKRLQELDLPISLSSDIVPEYREYERMTTTVVNALVSPIMTYYLTSLENKLHNTKIRIMQSNGGAISIGKAKRDAIHTILSGPAGGVLGAFEMAKLSGTTHIITFDMGGTSTDVSLCNGAIQTTSESMINNIPIKVPVIDIHTVGAGGGSIAFIDDGGALNVGPISAGADPGPICYGKGDQITVTDAHLFLGRLDPEFFLGGHMSLTPESLKDPFDRMAKILDISPAELADGIIHIANHKMEQAIQLISIEKGYDPKGYTLVSFGGAGGLHACELMDALSIPGLIIPKNPGLLSATGMILSNVVKDYSQSILSKTEDISLNELDQQFRKLIDKGVHDLLEEGFSRKEIIVNKSLDMRYMGQSFELNIPFTSHYLSTFHNLHEQRYNYCSPEKPCETVTIRIKVIGITRKPSIKEQILEGSDPKRAFIKEKEAIIHGHAYQAKIYNRDKLKSGNHIYGPAIIVEYSSTTVLLPNYFASIDLFESLCIQVKGT